ncbi:MAG: aspartate carbamoyltransferase catalytic subunit [Pseudomonadota bacterium]
MKHLTGIGALSDEDITEILSRTLVWDAALETREGLGAPLKGRLLFNLFYENSTRTSLSFQVAATRMGADVISVPVAASSVHKGESLKDTVLTLCAQGADFMVLRASGAGTIETACKAMATFGYPTSVINAGEGAFGHPTQGLLDAATLLKATGRSLSEGLRGLTVAIVGDLLHSRVAASTAPLLARLGAEVRYCGPEAMLPQGDMPGVAMLTTDRAEALAGADVVMALRIQMERLEDGITIDPVDYRRSYGLTREALSHAKPNVFVMHPGPMNRGVEIDTDVADDQARSLILSQVAMGVPTRMAVLEFAAAL